MWEYDPYHSSIITAGNGGTKPTQAAFTIFYNQGTQRYDLEQTLQPDEQMWIDVGKLIREQVPDKSGKVLPADLTSGSYEFRDLTDFALGALFEGKVIYDKTYGHVAYGCANCCGTMSTQTWFNPLGVPFASTAGQGVNGYDNCALTWDDISSFFYSDWTAANTAIATVDYYGTHSGVSAGSTSSSSWANMREGSNGLYCPRYTFRPSGGVNVSPKIMFNGQNITGTTQSVVVGQQIALTASYGNITPTSQSWTVPGTIVAGYTPSSNSGSLNTNVTLNQQSTTFYWVFATSSQVTFTLNYGSNQTATAQATFNISAPAPATPTVSLPTNGNSYIDTFAGCTGYPTQPFLVFGNISGPVPGCAGTYTGAAGISFSPPSTATPSGQFFFVQLVTSDNVTYPNLSCAATPGLDGAYPYQSKYAQTVNDAPFAPLPYSSITRSFGATIYLMWQSSTSSSIPVPMGSVAWSFSSSSSQTNGVWSTPSGGGTAGPFTVPSTTSGYPVWNNLAVPANNNCH
jgi:hypothetical protein